MTHSTFEAYCKERWGYGRHYANRIIGAKEANDALVPNGTKPITEGAIRPLTLLRTPDGKPDVELRREDRDDRGREAEG